LLFFMEKVSMEISLGNTVWMYGIIGENGDRMGIKSEEWGEDWNVWESDKWMGIQWKYTSKKYDVDGCVCKWCIVWKPQRENDGMGHPILNQTQVSSEACD
jgi:hypothetical protein